MKSNFKIGDIVYWNKNAQLNFFGMKSKINHIDNDRITLELLEVPMNNEYRIGVIYELPSKYFYCVSLLKDCPKYLKL